MNQGLTFVKPLTWKEVFQSWEEAEAHLEHWMEHYKKRGFTSWQDWRVDSMKELNLESLRWDLYAMPDPSLNVPKLHGGPFRSWIKNIYHGAEMPPFSEIVKDPQIQKNITNSKIIENFPEKTLLIGLVVKEKTVIIEGMKRCCAIALAAQRNQPVRTEVTIALATFPGETLPLLGQAESPT